MFPFFNMYSSKAEQILSRYRPIAPKPPSAPSANGIAKPDQAAGAADSSAPAQSSSSVSLGCKKGGRKRSGDYSLASPRSYKRSASANRKNQQQQQQIQLQIQQQIHSQSQQIVPALVDAGGSLSTVTSMGSEVQALPALEPVGWKIVRPGVALGLAGSIGNTSPRSYAMSPNLVLEDAGSSVITMPAGAALKSSLVAHKNASSNSRSLVSDIASNGFVSSNVQLMSPTRSIPVPPQLSPTPAARVAPLPQEKATRAQEQDSDEERPKLVTLSLLPDTPALSNLDLDRDRDRDRDRDDANRLELSLCSGRSSQRYTAAAHNRAAAVQSSEQRVPQFFDQNQSRQDVFHRQGVEFGRAQQQPVIDSSYLEQAYGGSSDPVVLTDDSSGAGGAAGSVVLWSNLSYNKMVSERLSGKPQRAAGPYIDPLGHPTQLGRFTYRMRGSECSAVLWGFLKKFMLLDHTGFPNSATLAAGEGGAGGSGEFAEQNASSNDVPHHHQQLHSPQSQNQNYFHHQVHQQQQQQGRVIAPQPIRLVVGSTVCLDSISKLDSYSGHLSGSLETVESQLEKDGVPALVTDRSNRVRWVNSAYSQLVSASSSAPSAPNGSSSSSREQQQQESGSSNKSNGASSAPPPPASSSDRQPEVCVTFQSERSPYSAVSLVGQARVDWMDGGKRCCLTGVPCEMRRLDDQQRGSLFVWKLNLNVGAVRHGQSAASTPVALHHFQAGQQLGQDCFGVRERGFM